MSRRTRTLFHVLIAALAVGFAAQTAKAQDDNPLDPVKVDPTHYKVLYEDSDIRVLRYDDEPGTVGPRHHHEYPFKVYVVTDATREFRASASTDTGSTCSGAVTDAKLVANTDPMPLKQPVTHCETNTGQTSTHLIVFEYKTINPTPPAAAPRPTKKSSRRGRR